MTFRAASFGTPRTRIPAYLQQKSGDRITRARPYTRVSEGFGRRTDGGHAHRRADQASCGRAASRPVEVTLRVVPARSCRGRRMRPNVPMRYRALRYWRYRRSNISRPNTGSIVAVGTTSTHASESSQHWHGAYAAAATEAGAGHGTVGLYDRRRLPAGRSPRWPVYSKWSGPSKSTQRVMITRWRNTGSHIVRCIVTSFHRPKSCLLLSTVARIRRRRRLAKAHISLCAARQRFATNCGDSSLLIADER